MESWPAVPAQVHYAIGDPWVDAADVDSFRESAAAAGASVEVHTYPGSGHLFADPEGPDFDAASAALMLERELDFLARF